MKCLSHHQLFSSWYSFFGDIKSCMKYSWDYFDAYKWKVMIMHGRMQFDKLILSWFEIFMIWNDAYAFVWCVSWMLKINKYINK